MPESRPKKIAYLFGAGATHAELPEPGDSVAEQKQGLLISDVSSRVIDKARRNRKYRRGLELVSSASGSLNIELLISLIEASKIHDWESKTQFLKRLVERDINGILLKGGPRRFYLHKALFEFHKHKQVVDKEELIGCISLNYDDVLDQAYRKFHGPPRYCFSLEQDAPNVGAIPLLKLHGSFNWGRQKIRGKIRAIEIIPLGSNKSYLHVPYDSIWNRAMEVLIQCDILRVIGCSLSQNDIHLIDLLFKAHLERKKPFDIEVIASEPTGDAIRRNYGFFPKIKTLSAIDSIAIIEGGLVSDVTSTNVFKTWLKYKALRMLGISVDRTKYLKLVVQ
jgi:hypothetical protein